jgi:lysine decarboxylase
MTDATGELRDLRDHSDLKDTRDPRDPRGLAADAPLLDGWLRFTAQAAAGQLTPMSVPGHKQRQDLTGAVNVGDAPLYGGVASIKGADGVLADAEARAARLWGADWCRFSVAGSTHGNQALALALGSPGQEVIVTRILHRSLLLGLVLAGLRPVWVRPEVDPASGLPGAVAVSTVKAALAEHPGACAVFLGEPSYVGTIGDLAGHAEAAHEAGVPLVVDAAWAAHLGFHPDLPPHALAAGADAMVTSAHKALPAYTQAALVLARTERLDPARLHRAFEATHTTSPAGSIMASIDAARALLARDGEELCARLLRLTAMAKARLLQVPDVSVLDGPGVEPTKLVVLIAGTGTQGYTIEHDLVANGMPVESADRDTVVPILTLADDEEHVDAFLDVLIASIERHRTTPRKPGVAASWTVVPEVVMSPRDAFFGETATLPADAAIGRVSAELIAPYPPGVPVLAPGELITAEAVESLREIKADGGRIAYAADPSLATFQVVVR